MFIPSASGQHDIQVGDPLPDTLSSLLVGYPYAYIGGGCAALLIEWRRTLGLPPSTGTTSTAMCRTHGKSTSIWRSDYGLRYELYTPITERADRTSSFLNSFPAPGMGQEYLINPRPTYQTGWNGWGPRVQVDWSAPFGVRVHVGGAITIIPPNLWQDNFLTGSTPYVVYPRVNANKNGEIAYGFQIAPNQLPQVYTPQGVDVLASGNPKKFRQTP